MSDSSSANADKKIIACILGIVLGSLGIHKFVLGYTKEGIIMLLVTVLVGSVTLGLGLSAMAIVGLIEGIIYLTKTDAEFVSIYVVGRRGWF